MNTVNEIMILAEEYANASVGDYLSGEGEASNHYDKLRTAIEELNKDARRYQWLMNNTKGFAPCVWAIEDGYREEYYSVNQVQIDAAMEKSE